MTGRSIIRALAVAASAALLVTALAAPVAAAKCDRTVGWTGVLKNVPRGEVWCAEDTGGRVLAVAAGGTFIGGPGADYVDVLHGVFRGRGGNDRVYSVAAGGTFIGGPGADSVTQMDGMFSGRGGNDSVGGGVGVFIGGPGDDAATGTSALMLNFNGTFIGGPGDDRYGLVSVGTFFGGPGDDTVRLLYGKLDGRRGGLFVGGPGDDTINGCQLDRPRFHGVENVPPSCR